MTSCLLRYECHLSFALILPRVLAEQNSTRSLIKVRMECNGWTRMRKGCLPQTTWLLDFCPYSPSSRSICKTTPFDAIQFCRNCTKCRSRHGQKWRKKGNPNPPWYDARPNIMESIAKEQPTQGVRDNQLRRARGRRLCISRSIYTYLQGVSWWGRTKISHKLGRPTDSRHTP